MSLHVDIKKKLASFDLEIALDAESETVGLLGESGCGKSMTMRSIAGIEKPDEGVIIVNGETYFDSAAGIDLTPQQRKTALLFQNYMLFPHMTVETNVAAGIDKSMPEDERNRLVAQEIERFNLQGLEKRYPMQLSGGQQQRVALARMLAAKPGILMLDEPFSALDAHLKDQLAQNLINLFDAFSGTILYVSHDIDEAVRFCDRIAVMKAGHIMEMGTADDVVNHPQSEAGLKLSGCKNVVDVERLDASTIHILPWGIDLACEPGSVPPDVKKAGIRSFFVERADGPGQNNYHVKVVEISDTRYNRTAMLAFTDSDNAEAAQASSAAEGEDGEEANTSSHWIGWRVDKLDMPERELPHPGEELWIHIPQDRIFLVNR